MARTPQFYHHGRSPAAWVGSITASIGFLIAAVGSVTGPMWVLIVIGAAVILLAGLATMVMKAMGMGQAG